MELMSTAAMPLGNERTWLRRRSAVIVAQVALTTGALALAAGALDLQSRARPVPTPPRRPHALAAPAAGYTAGLSRLPTSAQGPISAALGGVNAAYTVSGHGGRLRAQSPGQDLRLSFDRAGVQVSSGDTRVGLSLHGVGAGAAFHAPAATEPVARANTVVYARHGLREWYRNGPLGLEQGFTIERSPESAHAGVLTLALALSGNVRASLASGGRSVLLRHDGEAPLRYGNLSATDASGRTLPSWLEVRGGTILLRVGTRGARYPLHIDPLVQQGEKLTGLGEVDERFGTSVAVSADGSTAAIGAPLASGEEGAVYVFARLGSSWVQQARLAGSEGRFGAAVALSEDGSTLIVGEPFAWQLGGPEGRAIIYTRSGSTWTAEQTLSGGGGEPEDEAFGAAVALSGDGSTALVGAPATYVPEWENDEGSAAVFTRSGETWSRQSTLDPRELVVHFGQSLALSSDGNTALIGGVAARGEDGAFVFTRSGDAWSQQGEGLPPTSVSAVALSADGNTALVGGASGARVYLRSGASWAQQGKALIGSGQSGAAQFGASLALSSSGDTALVGGPGEEGGTGAAWEFTRSGSTWTQQGAKLTGGGESGAGGFGDGVALSGDGTSLLIGGAGDGEDDGAAWAFAFAAGTPTTPAVVTGAASAVTHTTATLNATVNPDNANVTSCRFEYGTSATYGASVPCSSPPGSGESPVDVNAQVSGLSANTTYHFRITATNAYGSVVDADRTFTTEVAQAPTVASVSAEPVTATQAVLNATVDPNGEQVSACQLEYGTTSSYGTVVPCKVAGAGESPVAVSVPRGGLSPDTTYHFRFVATNATGTTLGADQTFTTATSGSLFGRQELAGAGQSVAISADGRTVAIGSPRDEWGGSVRIFTRSGSRWSEQARLTASGGSCKFCRGVRIPSV